MRQYKDGGLQMPKVTDEYLIDKRNYILQCTYEILQEKPLYLITMRDIIKQAGFSHGIIYHYYSNLEEIYVDYINKNTIDSSLKHYIDTLLNSESIEKEILFNCIIAMGEYIEELLRSVGGRTCFELIVYYAYDFEKRATIFPKLKFKQDLEYAQSKIEEYMMSNVEKGVFHPQIPVGSIIMFASNFIDGVAQTVATSSSKRNENSTDISIMFETLAKAVLCFL